MRRAAPIKPSLREFEALIPRKRTAVSRDLATNPTNPMPNLSLSPHPSENSLSEEEVVSAAGATIGEMLASLQSVSRPRDRICDEAGNIRRFVNIFLTAKTSVS